MQIQDIVPGIMDRLRDSACVKTVFGEPVTVSGRTIIPAARVAYGFGGGGGSGRKEGEAPEGAFAEGESAEGDSGAPSSGEGGGGGGFLLARPAGMVEITSEGARFIPATDLRRTLGLFAAGILVGVMLRRR